MPKVKKIWDNFIKEYGAKEGPKRYYAWEAANPKKAKKALKTAKSHGDKIVQPKKKKSKVVVVKTKKKVVKR